MSSVKRLPARKETIQVTLERRHVTAVLGAVKSMHAKGWRDADAARVRAAAIPYLEKVTNTQAERLIVPMSSFGAAVLAHDTLNHALSGDKHAIEAGHALVVAASRKWFPREAETLF